MSNVPDNERRLLRRWPGLAQRIRMRAAVSDPFETGSLFDLAMLGIGILTDTEWRAGTHLTLQPSRCHQPLPITEEVRHATMRADGRWLVGCSFPRPLTIDEVQSF